MTISRTLTILGIIAIVGSLAMALHNGRSTSAGPRVALESLDLTGVDVTDDAAARIALEFPEDRVIVDPGDPRVIFSKPVMNRDLEELGLPMFNYAPDCMRPMHVVIVAGDFDARTAMPARQPSDTPIPAAFLTYIIDVPSGGIATIIADPSGATVKKALDVAELPDRAEVGEPEPPIPSGSPYLPCEDTLAPGASEPVEDPDAWKGVPQP